MLHKSTNYVVVDVFLPYRLINQAFVLYSLLFGPSLQPPAHRTLSRIIFISTEILQFVALAKGPISSFISHFLKNKKHTNFNRYLHLYANQKLNKKKPERRSLYKPQRYEILDISEDGSEIELKHCASSKTSVKSSRKYFVHLNWIRLATNQSQLAR